MVEALASARSVIGALERGTSMKEEEGGQDKTIEQKKDDLSFVQSATTTQADFCNADSISSIASSDLHGVSAASIEEVGLKTPQDMVDRTPCTSNKEPDKWKREKDSTKKKKTPRVDTEMDTFLNM